MGRTLPLVVVATIAIFSFLLIPPAPLVSSAVVRPPGKIFPGRYFISSPKVKNIIKFLRKHAWDIIQNVLSAPGGQNNGDTDKLDTKAADTAGVYIFNLSVGTSALQQNISGILDITTELVWTQCAACTACLPASTFQPSKSHTFSGLPCSSQTCQSVISQPCANTGDYCTYLMQYSSYTNTTGYLATDTFTFGETPVQDVVFGCSGASFGDFSGASGVLGFSRGNLSLVSQLQLSWFSYFLASDGSSSSDNFLQFGGDAVPQTKNSHSTHLLYNGAYPDLYFVKLTGIKVGGQQLNAIPAGTFDVQADGTGGVFLSTTIPVTYLEEAAYNVVRQAFVSRIKAQAVNGSALGLDLCYSMQSIDSVPELTLVFDGANAEMKLKKHNYFFENNATLLECLTIMPSRGGSLLGSLLQTDMNMTYDIDGGQLIFETAFAPPAQSKVSLMVILLLVAWVLLT